MKRLAFLIPLLFLLLYPTFIKAQTTKEEFFSDIKHASGIYQTYSYVATPVVAAPKGYEPFYISHYGRHGSRWLLVDKNYIGPKNILSEAHKSGKLTALGQTLYKNVMVAAEDADARYGDLAPLGVREHRAIAERMVGSFPEVFSTKNGRKCYIYSRSTVVPRCIVSMAANNERIKELNPAIDAVREASARNGYLNYAYTIPNKDSVYAVCDNFLKKHLNTDRLVSSIFNDPLYAKGQISNLNSFAYDIYLIATDLPDIDYLNLSLFDIFTKDELFTLWQYMNLRTYYTCGPSAANGKITSASAKSLLRDILDCADNAITNNTTSADLRFGHDSYIIPLLALMDVKGMNIQESDPENVYKAWSDFKVSPMGANLQLIFYKTEKNDDVIVKLLHCEKEVEIPVKTDIAPYYHWKDVKAYYKNKL